MEWILVSDVGGAGGGDTAPDPEAAKRMLLPEFVRAAATIRPALLTVIQPAYMSGLSTRKGDELVQPPGLTAIEKSQVPRICKELGQAVSGSRDRRPEVAYPYL